MGIFRKIVTIALIAGMVLTVIPASAEVELKYAEDQTMTLMYSTEATSLCAFGASASANDWQAVSNCVEGLMTVDKYGNLLPGLAESYTVSEDAMTYTFHIREGLQWVDVKGKPMGELTAHDFVAVAKFTLEPERASPNALYFENVIQGAAEFLAGETDDFSIVAFEALDDYTLQISLVGPLPYFLSYCGSYQPAYVPLLEELGDNYGIDNETMYYVGAYIMTVFEPQYRRVYEKNPDYYNADEVFIEKVTMLYNAEYYTIGPELFLRGEIDYAQIDTAILGEWKRNDATKDIVIPSLPDTTYMYYYGFNYDPNFDEKYEPENWRLAINNENFRQSLYWAINREKAILCQDPYNPQMQFTNSVTPIGWCFVDGLDFTQIGPMAEITSRPNQQFNEAKALEYKEKAIEELTAAGVTFPVKVLMPYNPVLSSWENEVQVVKQQITSLLGEDYIECFIEAGPTSGFLGEIRRTGKYGLMKLNNGNNIDDPDGWTYAFRRSNNWTFLDLAKGEDIEALVAQYYELLDAAQADMAKSMSRYLKFAEAEAFLLNHAMVIPYCTDTWGYYVAYFNMLERPFNYDNLWRGMRKLAEPLTEAQFLELYDTWVVEQEASRVR